jgi:flagellar motility protein MotE (MotC chaperone)
VEAESTGEACLPKSALDDLVKRRKELEKRETELASREQELGSREKATQEELKKIQEVRAEIEKVQGVKTKENEEKIARTVELLETMNPKAASQVISTYDERLAVQAMARMSTPKLSKILNLMETKRSVRLMELMAGGGTPAGSAEASVPNTNAVPK